MSVFLVNQDTTEVNDEYFMMPELEEVNDTNPVINTERVVPLNQDFTLTISDDADQVTILDTILKTLAESIPPGAYKSMPWIPQLDCGGGEVKALIFEVVKEAIDGIFNNQNEYLRSTINLTLAEILQKTREIAMKSMSIQAMPQEQAIESILKSAVGNYAKNAFSMEQEYREIRAQEYSKQKTNQVALEFMLEAVTKRFPDQFNNISVKIQFMHHLVPMIN